MVVKVSNKLTNTAKKKCIYIYCFIYCRSVILLKWFWFEEEKLKTFAIVW